MRKLKRALVILALTAIGALGASAVAHADAPAPTNGGNGGGSSGICTGSPDGRPVVCPASP